MYKRQVAISLLITVTVGVVAAVVANIDPFQNNSVWTTWIALASVGMASSFASLVTVIGVGVDEGEYFIFMAMFVAALAVVGAFIAGFTVAGVQPQFQNLVWASYAVGLVSFILNGLVSYLVVAESPAKDKRRSLRRVA